MSTSGETKIIKTASLPTPCEKVVVVTKDRDAPSKKPADDEDEPSSFEETSESGSEIDSDEEEGLSLNTQEIIDTDILFTVLKQFFISKTGRNIADILEDISVKLDRRRRH
jgi:hypothetical protein